MRLRDLAMGADRSVELDGLMYPDIERQFLGPTELLIWCCRKAKVETPNTAKVIVQTVNNPTHPPRITRPGSGLAVLMTSCGFDYPKFHVGDHATKCDMTLACYEKVLLHVAECSSWNRRPIEEALKLARERRILEEFYKGSYQSPNGSLRAKLRYRYEPERLVIEALIFNRKRECIATRTVYEHRPIGWASMFIKSVRWTSAWRLAITPRGWPFSKVTLNLSDLREKQTP